MNRWGPFSSWWFCDFPVEINCIRSPLQNQRQCLFAMESLCLEPWLLLLSLSIRCYALTDHQWPLGDLQIKESQFWTVEHETSHLKWLPVTPIKDAAWASLGCYGGSKRACALLSFGCWSLVCAQLPLDKVEIGDPATASPQQWFLIHSAVVGPPNASYWCTLSFNSPAPQLGERGHQLSRVVRSQR